MSREIQPKAQRQLTRNATKMRMQLVDGVVRSIVESKNNVSLDPMDIADEHIADTRSIWDEVCANARG